MIILSQCINIQAQISRCHFLLRYRSDTRSRDRVEMEGQVNCCVYVADQQAMVGRLPAQLPAGVGQAHAVIPRECAILA